MKPVLIYSTAICPYCDAAKKLLQSLHVEYEEVRLDGNDALRQKLAQENNGWRTVPMIFIHGKFVGGFDDLNKLHKAGTLKTLLTHQS